MPTLSLCMIVKNEEDMGEACLKAGEKENACEAYEQALLSNPGLKEAKNRLEVLRFKFQVKGCNHMSQPSFPSISPAMTREDVINQILSSIAM